MNKPCLLICLLLQIGRQQTCRNLAAKIKLRNGFTFATRAYEQADGTLKHYRRDAIMTAQELSRRH